MEVNGRCLSVLLVFPKRVLGVLLLDMLLA